MADVTDMIHKGTGALISHDFSALYKKEWHKARDSLRATKSDEEIIYILLRIVRVSHILSFLFYKVRLLPYNVKICINFELAFCITVYAKTRAQIFCAVIAQLIIAFVFAT